MKEVIVVGSVNRNSRRVVIDTVKQLVCNQYRVWISESFEIRGINYQVKAVPGTGNIAKRMPKYCESSKILSDRFYVCVLPYHGQETKHELDSLKKLKVIKFMRVHSDGTVHDCKLREVLEPVAGCDPLSRYRTELEFKLLEV